MEVYLGAAEFRLTRNAWGNTGIGVGFQQAIESVDRYFRKGAPSDMPRFIGGPRAATNTKSLIKALKLYASFPGPGNKFLRQAPIMVGCTSTTIEKRTKTHIHASGLTSTTATWGLTLCLLHAMGHHAEVVVVPVMVTVTNEVLPLAEQLVTALAQSLVEQHGFNIVQAGSQGNASTGRCNEVTEDHVIINSYWVLPQLEKALDEINRRKKLEDDVEELQRQHSRLRGLITRVNTANALLRGAKDAVCSFFGAVKKQDDYLDRAEEAIRVSMQNLEDHRAFAQLQEGGYGPC